MRDPMLDREVAERVLGYTVQYERYSRYHLVDSAMCPILEPPIFHLTRELAWDDCPEFSVDLNYAWAVVAELQMAGYGFGLYGTEGEWIASFENGAHDEHEAEGDTPGEAICRAALQVVDNGTLYAQGGTGY